MANPEEKANSEVKNRSAGIFWKCFPVHSKNNAHLKDPRVLVTPKGGSGLQAKIIES